MTVEELRAFGAAVDEGLGRCLNNETFYLRLVRSAAVDGGYALLSDALAAKDLKKAFEQAHRLKGMLGNLSLTPLYDPVSALTEILRAGSDDGARPLLNVLLAQRDALCKLCENNK